MELVPIWQGGGSAVTDDVLAVMLAPVALLLAIVWTPPLLLTVLLLSGVGSMYARHIRQALRLRHATPQEQPHEDR